MRFILRYIRIVLRSIPLGVLRAINCTNRFTFTREVLSKQQQLFVQHLCNTFYIFDGACSEYFGDGAGI